MTLTVDERAADRQTVWNEAPGPALKTTPQPCHAAAERADLRFAESAGLVWMDHAIVGFAKVVTHLDANLDYEKIASDCGRDGGAAVRRMILAAGVIAWQRFDGGNIDEWRASDIAPQDMSRYLFALRDQSSFLDSLEACRREVAEELLHFARHQLAAALNADADEILDAVLALADTAGRARPIAPEVQGRS